ncbi:DUF1120 domain-containing protein [Enterobacteriaceae bacterium Kacie_13]|nr:DUF1120 domain-containing protein [Enterobacteriaceae bacterium Kacie_13]
MKYVREIILSITLLMSVSTQAATATVQIKGTVAPGSCIPSLSNNGVVDIGNLDSKQLEEGVKVVSVQNISLDIICTNPTRVAYTLTDNRHESLPAMLPENIINSADLFGLGKSAGQIAIGSWYITVPASGLIEGIEAQNIASHNTELWLPQTENNMLSNTNGGKPVYYSFARDGETTPSSGSAFSTSFSVNVALSSELKSITEVAQADGNAAINIIYL